jgi:hypothetical protein
MRKMIRMKNYYRKILHVTGEAKIGKTKLV